MATAHIAASKGDFAPTVLMPGDPLRSRFIAENFLEQARLVNDVRGVQGYTGFYHGERISVMASGMGIPSIGIYSYELYHFFDVENIIRVGTIGTVQPDVRVRDIILAMGASTDSNFVRQFELPGSFAPLASYALLRNAVQVCEDNGLRYHVGNVLSTDIFYGIDQKMFVKWAKLGILGVEMETAALYITAAAQQKRALSVMTVSNDILTGEETTAEERQSGFQEMMKIALETAVKMQSRKQ